MPDHWAVTESSRHCRKCGARADQRDRFCRICGAELTNGDTTKPRPMFKLIADAIASMGERIRVFVMPKQEKQRPTLLIEAVPQTVPSDVGALFDKIKQLESEKEDLRLKLLKQRFASSKIIAYSLLAIGAVALILSIIFSSSILAFIGLGLAFWGALFLFIRPEAYVKAKLLDPTVLSSLMAIDEILGEEACQGKGLYLASKHGHGFKDGTVFIPAKNEVAIPSTDEIAGKKVFSKNPQGVCLLSPGYGLTKLFEKELGVDFSKVDLDYLQKNLPKLLVEDLEVVEDFSMNVDGELVEVKMVGAIYHDLCREVRKLNNICLHLGCPIISAIGCALAKVTGKPVVFEGDKLSSGGKEIHARYRIIAG